jgi:hypothetical protein
MEQQEIELRSRRKTFSVSRSFLSDLFIGGLERDGCVHLPEVVGLPTTAICLGIHQDFQSDSILFMVADKSFPVVPEGSISPRLEVQLNFKRL